MKKRVRGVLVTPGGNLLTIKRVRPGVDPYRVLPGGGVEPGDTTLEAALLREIDEELAGRPGIDALIHVMETGEERQYFFLGRIGSWDHDRRTGPEFADPSRGRYVVEEVPLDPAHLTRIAVKPEPIARLIAEHASDLFRLANLRLTREV
ncbi:NUDIX domain-containing protein [Sphaerimonospora mesophila]|uniref:NUDIX domain-containing protein n=1 Tax=Sphaerimonospora mesophila TaxID=37483 RepID=UPI0006E1F511